MSRIALQIFLTIFLTLILTALAATAITSWYWQHQEETVSRELRQQAGKAAEALANHGMDGLLEWAREQDASDEGWLILVLDDWGDEILGREPPKLARPPGMPISPWLDMPAITLDLGRDNPMLINEFGDRYQLIPVPRADEVSSLTVSRDSRLLLLLIAAVITLLFSLLLARLLTRPILELQQTTERLAAGNLQTRTPSRIARRRDELGELARSLDQMSMQLEQLIQSREHLLRDISHELRSPLARMRLAAGLLAQQSQNPEYVQRIDREITRLDALIAGILELSRIQRDSSGPSQTIDLLTEIDRVFEDAAFEARQSGKALNVTRCQGPLMIRGYPGWSAAAVENVLRNAIRHTPVSGDIKVVVASTPGEHRITVENTGATIPDNELQRIFEPFHRIASAQPSGSTGSGLGLAIAARVMQAHGGQISASNLSAQDGGTTGVRVQLRWPQLDHPQLQADT